MNTRDTRPGSTGGADVPDTLYGGPDDDYTPEQLAAMNRQELDRLGARYDGVEIMHVDPGPEPGSAMEQRAVRQVGMVFGLAGLFAFLFIVVYVGSGWFLPDWQWDVTEGGWSALFTPMLGLFMGLSLLCVGVGLVLFTKKLLPHETAVQDKHDGSHFDRVTAGATLVGGWHNSGLARRKLITRSLALMGGGVGLMLIMPLGGLIKNPNRGDPSAPRPGPRVSGCSGTTARRSAPATRSRARWRPSSRPFRVGTARPTPPRCSSGSGPSRSTTWNPARGRPTSRTASTSPTRRSARTPAVRSRSTSRRPAGSSARATSRSSTSRRGQAGVRSRHPCAPQLPLGVDDEGFFVARSDYIEAVGPTYWNRERI
ncbi:(2Fe-2S)-binding protein [Blastococcus brunescens]|uniref:(2Fe-2S)-binding protein n=1 Tax=Blastococcus brunescens TaxID=1564165 RepID=UPI003BEEB0A1